MKVKIRKRNYCNHKINICPVHINLLIYEWKLKYVKALMQNNPQIIALTYLNDEKGCQIIAEEIVSENERNGMAFLKYENTESDYKYIQEKVNDIIKKWHTDKP